LGYFLHEKRDESCEMTPQKIMEIVIEKLIALKELSHAGAPIALDPSDFEKPLKGNYLRMAILKLDREYNVIRVFCIPKEDFEFFYAPSDVVDELELPYIGEKCYGINFQDGFDDFAEKYSKLANHMLPDYTTPYIQLMFQAIRELKLTPNNQPKKDDLENWFRDNAGFELSERDITALATFVRSPDMKKGGARPQAKKVGDS
jgi:hypothetical protein